MSHSLQFRYILDSVWINAKQLPQNENIVRFYTFGYIWLHYIWLHFMQYVFYFSPEYVFTLVQKKI